MNYQCWNPQCPNYAGNGVVLAPQQTTVDPANNRRCGYCGSLVHQVPQPTNSAGGVIGAAGGAALGWAVGGPPGAIIGGIVGLILGASSGSQQ